jgi:hypothetical protein
MRAGGEAGARVATAREYLAFRSFNLAGASASTPLAAPPIAWTSMDQARLTRVQNGTRHQTSLGARRHSPTSHLPCSSFVRHSRTLPMPSSCPWTVCPPALAPLYLTANGGEACLQPKPFSIHFDSIRQSVVTIHRAEGTCIREGMLIQVLFGRPPSHYLLKVCENQECQHLWLRLLAQTNHSLSLRVFPFPSLQLSMRLLSLSILISAPLAIIKRVFYFLALLASLLAYSCLVM